MMMATESPTAKSTGAHPNPLLIESIRRLYRKQAYTPLQKIFAKTMPADLASVFENLSDDDVGKIFGLVQPPATAALVLKELSIPCRLQVLADLPAETIIPILEKMAPDARADLIGQLDGELADQLMAGLAVESKKEVETLLQYPPDTAGSLMTSQFFALPENTLVAAAIEAVRGLATYEMVFYLYVVDHQGRLIGVSSLRQLLLAHPQKTLGQMMNSRVIQVIADTPAREVAEQVRRHRLMAVPVVDRHGVLIGLVTVDDLIDVVETEVADDIFTMAGTHSSEFAAQSFLAICRIRLPWLLIVFAGGLVTALVLESQLPILLAHAGLILLLPAAMALVGHAANQAATVAVRGLAMGVVKARDYATLLAREMGVGLILGSFYGLALAAMVWLLLHDPRLTQVAGLTMACNMTVAVALAASMPFFFTKIGISPALASGPFVLAAIDLLGVINYLVIAGWVFGE